MTQRARGGARNVAPGQLAADYEKKGALIGTDPLKRAAYYSDGETPPPLAITLAVHRALVENQRSMPAHEFALGLADAIRNLIPQPENMSKDEFLRRENLDAERLRGWVQISRPVGLPDREHRDTVIEALRRYAAALLFRPDQIAAFDEPWGGIETLLLRLTTGPEAKPKADSVDAIDPTLRYLGSRKGDEHEDLALELADILTGELGGRRVLVLSGSAYAGKRRLVARILSACLTPEGQIQLRDGTRMAVFARSTCFPFEVLIRDIAQFLKIDLPPAQPIIQQLDRILDDIQARVAKTSTAFVLCEVPSADDPTGLARRMGMDRLIRILSTDGNRLLLTAEEQIPDDQRLRTYNKDIPAVASTLGRLFANFGTLEALCSSIFDMLPWREITVDGPLLNLLETLKDLTATLSSLSQADVLVLRKALVSLGEQCTGPEITPLWKRKSLQTIASAIYDLLGPDAQPMLRHLAMSEDGIRLTTFKIIFPTVNVSDLSQTALRLAEALPRICLVKKYVHVAHEDPPEERDRDDDVFELVPPFREIFDWMLLRRPDTEQLYRKQNWNIVFANLERAHWARLYTQSALPIYQRAVARELQGLLRALVAIDPEALGGATKTKISDTKQGVNQPDLHFSFVATRRFAWSNVVNRLRVSPNHDYIDYYRFLYHDVFRSVVDRDYQLTRTFQRHDAKLRTVAAFLRPGWPVPASFAADISNSGSDGSMEAAQETDREIVEMLTVILSADEALKLFESAALASSSIECWAFIRQARRCAEILVRDHNVEYKSLHRILRSEIDLGLLTCGRRARGKDGVEQAGPNFQNLAELNSLVEPSTKRLYNELRFLQASLDTDQSLQPCRAQDGFRQLVDLTNAYIKVAARLAEIRTWQGNLEQSDLDQGIAARAVYGDAIGQMRRLVSIGARLGVHQGIADAWSRSPFAGQAGRRFIRFVYELRIGRLSQTVKYYEAMSPVAHDPLLSRSIAFQDANLRRLTRHPNERPTAIVNEALLSLIQGKWHQAQSLLLNDINPHSLHAGETLSSALFVGCMSATACLDVIVIGHSDVRDRSFLQSDGLLGLVEHQLEMLLRVTQPGERDYPLFWTDALLLAARYLTIRDELNVRRDWWDKLDGVRYFDYALQKDHLLRTPKELLSTALAVVDGTGYGLRRPSIERLLKQL